ncbi:MAG: hypothetical protein RL347_1445 [Actinomycetota bacterium]|jgi:hypothetical protein
MANSDILDAQYAWSRIRTDSSTPSSTFEDYVDAAIELMVERFGDAPTVIPKRWKLAAFEVCKQLWTADQSGDGRPSSGDPIQRGFAWPARALELMNHEIVTGGFA